jgi:hypothetical protein
MVWDESAAGWCPLPPGLALPRLEVPVPTSGAPLPLACEDQQHGMRAAARLVRVAVHPRFGIHRYGGASGERRRCHRNRVKSRVRVVGRRVVVVAVVVLQLGFVARGYWSDHKEFAFQMFPESSTWRADVVRVTVDGRRVPIERPWSGYRWDELVPNLGLSHPSLRHHASAGLDNQLAFLGSALDWVASNTPRDRETRYLEATVTSWHNADRPQVGVLRSRVRGRAE